MVPNIVFERNSVELLQYELTKGNRFYQSEPLADALSRAKSTEELSLLLGELSDGPPWRDILIYKRDGKLRRCCHLHPQFAYWWCCVGTELVSIYSDRCATHSGVRRFGPLARDFTKKVRNEGLIRPYTWPTFDEAAMTRAAAQGPCVGNTDIKNFFPFVNRHHVEECLSGLGVRPALISEISEFVKSYGGLPVGYQTSDILAGMILLPLDDRLSVIGASAIHHGDDFRVFANSGSSCGRELARLCSLIEDVGFLINAEKTRVYSPARSGWALAYSDLGEWPIEEFLADSSDDPGIEVENSYGESTGLFLPGRAVKFAKVAEAITSEESNKIPKKVVGATLTWMARSDPLKAATLAAKFVQLDPTLAPKVLRLPPEFHPLAVENISNSLSERQVGDEFVKRELILYTSSAGATNATAILVDKTFQQLEVTVATDACCAWTASVGQVHNMVQATLLWSRAVWTDDQANIIGAICRMDKSSRNLYYKMFGARSEATKRLVEIAKQRFP